MKIIFELSSILFLIWSSVCEFLISFIGLSRTPPPPPTHTQIIHFVPVASTAGPCPAIISMVLRFYKYVQTEWQLWSPLSDRFQRISVCTVYPDDLSENLGSLRQMFLPGQFSGTVELQWLEHWWLVYHGCFELVLESLGKLSYLQIWDNLGRFQQLKSSMGDVMTSMTPMAVSKIYFRVDGLIKLSNFTVLFQIHRRRRKRGGGGRGGRPPNNLRGGPTYHLLPHPNNPPTYSVNFYVKQEKNHKCTKLKGKIIINVTLIWFEGAGKTILSILSMNFL